MKFFPVGRSFTAHFRFHHRPSFVARRRYLSLISSFPLYDLWLAGMWHDCIIISTLAYRIVNFEACLRAAVVVNYRGSCATIARLTDELTVNWPRESRVLLLLLSSRSSAVTVCCPLRGKLAAAVNIFRRYHLVSTITSRVAVQRENSRAVGRISNSGKLGNIGKSPRRNIHFYRLYMYRSLSSWKIKI